MDYVTRQFINLTKKFRKELRQTLQKQTDAIGQAAKAARESKQEPLPVPLPVLAELRTPEADKTENRTQYKESRRLQILLTLGTWLAFLAAAIYAGIAARQLDQMIRANRPWVAPFPSENTQAFRVTTNTDGLNEGQKEIRSNVDIFMRNSGNAPAYIEKTQAGLHIYKNFPQTPEFTPCSIQSQPEVKTIIPGAATGFSCVYVGSRVELTEDLYAFANIEYRDIRTMQSYYAHTCKHWNPKLKGWSLCDTYNDAN